jgi:hypothetical protein
MAGRESIHKYTMPNAATPNNLVRMERLQQALAEVLAKSLQRGFYGTVQVEATIQDGVIQMIRRKIEQVEK